MELYTGTITSLPGTIAGWNINNTDIIGEHKMDKKIIIAMNGNDKNGKNNFINLAAERYIVRHRNFYDILSKNITWCDDKESILYMQFLKEFKE